MRKEIKDERVLIRLGTNCHKRCDESTGSSINCGTTEKAS
jgi:hypothetical protein